MFCNAEKKRRASRESWQRARIMERRFAYPAFLRNYQSMSRRGGSAIFCSENLCRRSRPRRGRRLGFHLHPRFDANRPHHAPVFVLEEMAVVNEGSYGVGIAEVHTEL